MADFVISFPRNPRLIGLIVRGKQGPKHHPDKLEQHADVILPNGAPIGFFGERQGSKLNSVGMSMKGAVYDYQALQIERPWYVSLDSAVANRVVSTVLLIEVGKAEAEAFEKYWANLGTHPGTFNIVGGNCSTHASDGFLTSKVLTSGIPGLDTPDNLYGQIVKEKKAGLLQTYTGYIGFTPNSRGGYNLTIRPYVAKPTVNKPKPHASTGLSPSVGTSHK
jgi:hypothetical protein